MKYILFLLMPFFAFGQKIEGEEWLQSYGVQTEPCSEGGLNVSYIDRGNWMDYKVKGGNTKFKIDLRVAANSSTSSFSLKVNNQEITRFNVPYTGGWQKWITLSDTIQLPEGETVLRVYCLTSGFNLNWFRLTPLNVPPEIRFVTVDTAYFPQKLIVEAKVKDEGPLKRAVWNIEGKVYGEGQGLKDDTAYIIAYPLQPGRVSFTLTAEDEFGAVVTARKEVLFLYDPFRIIHRVHLGALGDLVIMSNGDFTFTGPCTLIH